MSDTRRNGGELYVVAEITDCSVSDTWTFSNMDEADHFMNLVWKERTEDVTQTGEDLVMYRSVAADIARCGCEFDWTSFDIISRKNLSIDRYNAYRRWMVERESADARSYQYVSDLDGVPVFDTLFGCAVILQHDLLLALSGDAYYRDDVSHTEALEACERWAASHDASFYAAEKASFSLEAAAWEARKSGKRVVIAENLS